MPQIRIDLDDTLFAVLEHYAEEECRVPSGQATWLVRQALRARMQQETALQHSGGSVMPQLWGPGLREIPEKEPTA